MNLDVRIGAPMLIKACTSRRAPLPDLDRIADVGAYRDQRYSLCVLFVRRVDDLSDELLLPVHAVPRLSLDNHGQGGAIVSIDDELGLRPPVVFHLRPV